MAMNTSVAVRKRRYRGAGVNLLYVPALTLLLLFVAYPFVRGVVFSLTNWNGFSPSYHYVGLEQYRTMLHDPVVKGVIVNTLIYALGSALLQNAIGLGYAVLLDKKLRGSSVVRAIVYLPIMVSNLIMGYIWYFILQYNGGALNDVVRALGFSAINPLADRYQAVAVIVFVNTFQYVGVAMVLYLAGLQAVPVVALEAAEIDGASKRQRFWRVKFPLLMPSVTISMTLNVIGGLNIFGVIVALTNGGPGYATESLGTMMYELYFSEDNAGYAAALGVLMFVLAVVFGLASLHFFRRREVEL
jgi:raffinose/stachyose/melibiose transport system permease protein